MHLASAATGNKDLADSMQVVCSAYSVLILVAVSDGLGHHVWDTTLAELPKLPKLLQYAWALEIVYIPAIWLAKSALLFQLINIFTPMKSGPVYWACHILIWGNLVFYIAILFTIVFECYPIHYVWDFLHYEGHCIDRNVVLVATGAVNVFSDLLNILLPAWATWHLQMAPKRKAGIIAIFATGILAFVSSICRVVYATRILETGADVAFIVVQIGLWALAEVASVILCTCFPTMPRLLKLISDRRAKSKSRSSSPLGYLWKRIKAMSSKDTGSSTSGSGGPRSHVAEERFRLKHPYEPLWEVGTVASGTSERISSSEDIELGMPTLEDQEFTNLLEQRLNIGFTVPRFSYP